MTAGVVMLTVTVYAVMVWVMYQAGRAYEQVRRREMLMSVRRSGICAC